LIKKYFLTFLSNVYAILKSRDFKNTIFKISFIEIALLNRPLIRIMHPVKGWWLFVGLPLFSIESVLRLATQACPSFVS
jgi:hypothetical protein